MTSIVRTFGLLLVGGSVLLATEWNVDPAHSTAAFAVKHMMVSTVHGNFSNVKGTVDYDAGKLNEAKANLTIEVASLSTSNERRDNHLKSPDFFDAQKYPTITFVSTKVVPGSTGKFQLVGDMTMHGVTKQITFDVAGPESPIKDGKGNMHTGATATSRISRKDFGLTWNKAIEGGGVTVGDDVDITIEVELVAEKKS
jgi:polyisoprenoid-binding protein YceI